MKKPRYLPCSLLAVVLLAQPLAFQARGAMDAIAQTNTIEVLSAARTSRFLGQVNRTQAAGLLERMILEGQNRAVLLAQLGVDPRIIGDVHADRIRLAFKTFDQFSRTPVYWSPMGSQMRDFNAKWQDVRAVNAREMRNAQGEVVYWTLELACTHDGTSTLIPLVPLPAGYTPSDVLLMVCVLNGTEKAGDAQERELPPPEPIASSTPSPTTAPAETDAQESASVAMETEPPTEGAPPDAPPENPLLVTPATPRPEVVLPGTPEDLRNKLETLKKLHDDGLIDHEVYKEKQRAILEHL